MAGRQLPAAIEEFASYLRALTRRIDPDTGWYAVFAQRDPEGLRACLDGEEIPPWDVVQALLQDLSAQRGAQTANVAAARAATLYRASITVHDAAPGTREALRARLAAMHRERTAAADRERELEAAQRAGAETTPEGDPLDAALAWAQDDHHRATARCEELTARLEALPGAATTAPPGTPPGPGPGPAARPAGAAPGPESGAARGQGRWPVDGADSAAGSAGARSGPWSGSMPGPARRPVDGVDPGAGPAGAPSGAWPGAATGPGRPVADGDPAGGPAGAPSGPWPGPEPGPGSGPGRRPMAGADPAAAPAGAPLGRGGPAGGPSRPAAGTPAGSGPGSPVAGVDPGAGLGGASARPWPRTAAEPGAGAAGAPSGGPGGRGSWVAGGLQDPSVAGFGGRSQAPQAEGPAPGAPSDGAGPPPPRPRGARFAAAYDGAPDPVAEAAPPSRPRGARFAGAEAGPAKSRWGGGRKRGREAELRARASEQQELAEARRAAAGAVTRLGRLRAEGRSGEAHAVLCETVVWPAGRLPVLAAELERAGLGADVATLLWEMACLQPVPLAAAAQALIAAGREPDGERLLRQSVARPLPEVAQTALALLGNAAHSEVALLLTALIRARTPAEVAEAAAEDPGALVPLLLDAAGAVSPGSQHDLAHAFRVAGIQHTG